MFARTPIRARSASWPSPAPAVLSTCLVLAASCAEVGDDEPPLPAPAVDAGRPDAAYGASSGGGSFVDVPGRVDAATSRPLPNDTQPGEWSLNADSAKECPAEPPPIPIIGGACLGIYYGCGWTHPDGRTYSCVCDWVHWLCI